MVVATYLCTRLSATCHNWVSVLTGKHYGYPVVPDFLKMTIEHPLDPSLKGYVF